LGFYISDRTTDQRGFAASDLDELIARSAIKVAGRAPVADFDALGGGSRPNVERAFESPPRSEPDAFAVAWYDELRERYRPDHIEVLLIAESPPDPGDGDRRFFYTPVLSRHDNLYRGVAQAVYGTSPDVAIADKRAVLERLKRDGFWLIDAVEYPVNRLSAGARKRLIAAEAPDLVARCRRLDPRRGVIVCKGPVYDAVAQPLRAGGIRVLHDVALPFPLGNWRAHFVAGVRRALGPTAT